MKKIVVSLVILFCAVASSRAMAADPEPIIVPLKDASHPPTVHVQMMMGGITIRGEDRKDISVESRARLQGPGRNPNEPRSDGMKRLDLGASNGLDIREENNVVTIKTDVFGKGGDLTILVPRRSSLQLKCMSGGDIRVEDVEGEIEAENLNGSIDLKEVGGSIVAHSLNGAVLATLKSVDPSKAMSFSTLNGNIDVTMPENVKAKVSLKTDNGEILSDFDVNLDANGKAVIGKAKQPGDPFHVQIDKTLHGTINGGGPEYLFRSFNGQIFIRKGSIQK